MFTFEKNLLDKLWRLDFWPVQPGRIFNWHEYLAHKLTFPHPHSNRFSPSCSSFFVITAPSCTCGQILKQLPLAEGNRHCSCISRILSEANFCGGSIQSSGCARRARAGMSRACSPSRPSNHMLPRKVLLSRRGLRWLIHRCFLPSGYLLLILFLNPVSPISCFILCHL